MLVRRIARPLMSTIFIAGGIDALRNPAPRAKAATPLIEQGKDALPDNVAANVPEDPEQLVRINGAIQLGGGLLLATGKAPRIASIALAASLVPTTLAGHSFWEETDPEAKAAQRIQFMKNVSLLGGLLIAAVDTEGKPSIAWRGRRAARVAQGSIAGALPGSHDASNHVGVASDRVKELAAVATARGSELADAAQPVVSKWADTATEKGSELAEAAQPVLSKWSHKAADRSSELGEIAQKRGSVLAARAGDRSAELTELAQKRGAVLAETASVRGAGLAGIAQERGGKWADLATDRASGLALLAQDRGTQLADVAAERSQGLSKRARKRADKQGREFEKATEKARVKLEKKVDQARKDLDKRVQKLSK